MQQPNAFYGLVAVGLVVWYLLSQPTRAHALAKRKWTRNSVSLAVSQGYNSITKVTGKPFFVRYWSRDYLVLSPKYLPDVRRAAKEHLVFVDSISDVFFLYNWIGSLFESTRMQTLVMKGINPRLPKLSYGMLEECEFAMKLELGDNAAPKEVPALEVLTSISLRIVARFLAGTQLSRDQAFLDGANGYFNGNFLTGFIMLYLPFPPFLRDIISWPLWKYHHKFRQQRLINIIMPVMEKRMKEHEQGMSKRADGEYDAIQTLLDLIPELPLDEGAAHSPVHVLSHEILQLVWAAGQSPAISIAAVLFKMLAEPSYLAALRTEAEEAVKKNGWKEQILNELPMMDSFIREVHRFHPAFVLNATRVVRNYPFTFHDGLTVPVGTRIAFPAEATQMDPDLMVDPEKFDGFRFVKLEKADVRQEDGVNRWSASHASYNNMTFGYGNHACPGRFMGIRIIKIIISRMLVDFDISWDRTDGEPPRFIMEGLSVPSPTQKITFQRRQPAL